MRKIPFEAKRGICLLAGVRLGDLDIWTGEDGEEFPLLELGISCKFGSATELSTCKNKKLFYSEQSGKMVKLFCLGAEGWEGGECSCSQTQSPCGPTAGWRSSLHRGWGSAAPEVSPKASWAAQKLLYLQNTTALTRQQTRLRRKPDLLSSESWLCCQSLVREAALWNVCTEGCVLFFLGCI